MQKFGTLSDAIALAEFAHRNQIDKSGQPYINHPKRVLAKVQAQGGLPYVQQAAILHDVTEDTAYTPQMLLDLGFSEATVKVVKLLDRGYSKKLRNNLIESYPDWRHSELGKSDDEYYYEEIRKDPWARIVKLADIEDNLSPWRLVYLEEATQTRLLKKYSKAKQLLGRDI